MYNQLSASKKPDCTNVRSGFLLADTHYCSVHGAIIVIG